MGSATGAGGLARKWCCTASRGHGASWGTARWAPHGCEGGGRRCREGRQRCAMLGRLWLTLKGTGQPVGKVLSRTALDPGVLSTHTTPGAHVWGPQGEGWRGDDVGTRGLSEGRCGQGKR